MARFEQTIDPGLLVDVARGVAARIGGYSEATGRGSCIVSTLIAVRALQLLGVQARPQSVQVAVMRTVDAALVFTEGTVGLNWTAIGIEHVGTSDQQILSNPKQMASSLALTDWLMSLYHINLADVIGHNESRTSRFHHELYPGWRCQTHGDWSKADMDIYRARANASYPRPPDVISRVSPTALRTLVVVDRMTLCVAV
jgi:hypothetical protein